MIFHSETDPVGPHIDSLSRQLDAIGQRLELALAKPPEPWFGMHTPDWIQAGLLAVAIAALIYTGLSLRETARGRDVENYLKFLDLITGAWRRVGAAAVAEDEATKKFEFLELINILEAACHMYNKKVITGTTREMIRDYLIDTLPKIFSTASAEIAAAQTAPNTYIQIRYFAHSVKLNGVPQTAPHPPGWKFWRPQVDSAVKAGQQSAGQKPVGPNS